MFGTEVLQNIGVLVQWNVGVGDILLLRNIGAEEDLCCGILWLWNIMVAEYLCC